MKRELLIGCGSSRQKKLRLTGDDEWHGLVTLDYNAGHKPDIVHDLNSPVLPCEDNSFDEIHAYEVLEHVGTQGDWRFFFAQFSDFWRVLKPDGLFFATCPSVTSRWAWGDPSHTRVLQNEHLNFLRQPQYENVGKTAMSDFRFVYKADFDVLWFEENDIHFQFVLKAVKPSRFNLG